MVMFSSMIQTQRTFRGEDIPEDALRWKITILGKIFEVFFRPFFDEEMQFLSSWIER